MTRIIPWTLPPVKGGSIGGYTPQPTPTPVSNDPYDLSDMEVSLSFKATTYGGSGIQRAYYLYPNIAVSGIEILDASNVGSVVANVGCTAGSVDCIVNLSSGTTTEKRTIAENDWDIDISSFMTLAGGTAPDFAASITADLVDDVESFAAAMDTDGKYGGTPAAGMQLNTVTSVLSVNHIYVYNSNGVVIQTWTPE